MTANLGTLLRMASILVVDDEIGIRDLLSEILSDEGHTVEAAENAQQAREFRQQFQPDLVLLDIWMPDTDGVTLLKEWASAGQLTMPVIMMSGHGTIDNAVEATRIGAMAFLEKPIALQKLLRAVQQGLSKPAPTSHAAVQHIAPSPSPALPEPAPLIAEQSFTLDRPLREARDDFERAYFEFHLAREGGSMTRVADKTGLERTHLYRKLKQLGVDWGRTGRKAQLASSALPDDDAAE